MITIIITGIPVGKALLYEYRGKTGRRRFVPSYHAYMIDGRTGEIFDFLVTRSASRIVFAHDTTDRYGMYGECPPNLPETSYKAFTSLDRRGQFCLRLYETPEPQEHNVIMGQSTSKRTNIMMHRGPGASQGCLMIAGGKTGHRAFEQWFKTAGRDMLPITVIVQPYP